MKKLNHDAIWDAIIRRMREFLSEKGTTQAKLAERMNVDKGTITRWLKGERKGSQSTVETLVGYMESLGMEPVKFFGNQDAQEQFIEVPWLEATASMGGGSVETSKKMITTISFRSEWIHRKGNPANMAIINASGGSMEPTIPDNSVVLIDESKVHDLVNGKIYFVFYDGEIFLKRLKVDKSGKVLALISDSDGSEKEIDPEVVFEILGRALWFGRDI
jgi:phage repressor protein C with HTH and peptisase S24 domain